LLSFNSVNATRLAVGSAAGSIRELFAKIKAIDAKHGKFDIVLCTGDFFGPTSSDDEKSDLPHLLAGQLEGGILIFTLT
jgi:hypothetical protein